MVRKITGLAMLLLIPLTGNSEILDQNLIYEGYVRGKGQNVKLSPRFEMFIRAAIENTKGDKSKAESMFRESARMGLAPAEYELGLLLSGKDRPESEQWISLASEHGYAPAQCDVAWSILQNIGNIKDKGKKDKATKQYEALAEKSARQGYAGCQLLQAMQPSTPLDKRRELLLDSAKQGMPNAQATLAEMYMSGNGILKNNIQAYAWFLNAKANNAPALDLYKTHDPINYLRSVMSDQDVAQAEKLAEEYYSSVINTDHAYQWEYSSTGKGSPAK